MRPSLVLLAAAAVAIAALAAVWSGAFDPPHDGAPTTPPTGGPPGAARWWNATVTSFDGTPLAVTVFQPANASEADPVPVVLHGHGWAGRRTTTPTGLVGRLVEAGYGVVSIDARGHGGSGGAATLMHKDVEGRDYVAVLDFVHDTLPWVAREPSTGIPKDVRAGAVGYSYGGAYQLVTASKDQRLDVLAPEITWSDLPEALAPNGVVKSAWVHFFYFTAKQSGTRVDPRIDEWYRRALVEDRLDPAALAYLEGANPDLGNITADVLLVQGAPDTLFHLGQAFEAYDRLQAGRAGEVRLFTHLTGHVMPIQPLGASPTRRTPFLSEGPCGDVHDTILAWMDDRLRGGPPSAIPRVSLALDASDECLVLDALPRGRVEVRAGAVAAPSAAGSVLVPLLDGPALLAGTPHVRAASPLGVPGRAFAGLVIQAADGTTRVVDDQAQPLPLGEPLDHALVPVAARVAAGEKLLLRMDGLNEWYATNGARAPGGAIWTDLVVEVPVLPAG